MTTEQRIREAWDIYHSEFESDHDDFDSFEAGYLALLNELEPSTVMGIDNVCGRKIYRLPEGVTK